jgi:hypothetical protein
MECPDEDANVPHVDFTNAQHQLMSLAEYLDSLFNSRDPLRRTSFVLMVNYTQSGDGDFSGIVSNMDNADLRAMIKMHLASLEGQLSPSAGHG